MNEVKTKKNSIILYGLGGIDINYIPLSYYCLWDDDISVLSIKHRAEIMVGFNPTIASVYMIDNHHWLKKDYQRVMAKKTIDTCIEFKDLLERYGMKIL